MSKLSYGAGLLVIGLASAGSGHAQNMALTPPLPPSIPAPADTPKLPEPPPRPALHAFGSDLPNQRTGPVRNRVVRDICIGCDR